VRLGGSSLATTVYYSPPRVNNVNVYFYTDHSVTRPSVSTSIIETYPAFALICQAHKLLPSHWLRCFIVLPRQHSYAIKNQLKAPKAGGWLPCANGKDLVLSSIIGALVIRKDLVLSSIIGAFAGYF